MVRYDQFTNTDSEYEFGVDQIFSRRVTSYVYAAVSPEADFRPDWRLMAGGSFRLDNPDTKGAAYFITLDARRDTYATTDVLNINPGIRIEPIDGWAGTFREITVDQENAKRVYGQEYRLDGTIRPGLRFNVGYASAPETVAAVTVFTKTYYGGITADIDDAHTLRFGYTRDDRENSYTRDMYNASASYRF